MTSSQCQQVTDLLLEMVAKAARQDQAFLIDLAALQEKHIETAKLLLGDGPALNKFAARLLDDMANLKAMLHAISIGQPPCDPKSNMVNQAKVPDRYWMPVQPLSTSDI